MNRKQKIIISITGIFLVLLLLVGLTYAYFLTKITGNTNTKSISVSTANLVLEYGENTNVVQGISNAEPGYEVSKIFTATNKGNSTVTYGAALESIVNQLSRQQDLVYTLTCTSYVKSGFTLASDGTIAGTEDGTCIGKNETQFPTTKDFQIMVTNTIDVNHIHAYNLTITYKNQNVDQSIDMNKTFSAKVNLLDTVALTLNNPYKSDIGTLKKAIIDNAMLDLNGTQYRETPSINIGEPASQETTNNYYKISNLTYSTPNETQYKHYENSVWYSNSYQLTCYPENSTPTTCSDFGVIDSDDGFFVPTTNIVNVGATLSGDTDTECGVGKYFYDAANSLAVPSSQTNSHHTFFEVLECTDGVPSKSRVMYFDFDKEEITKTIVMKEEKTLSKTIDDNGTSYYYRGTVEDNYVNFAGMCWKIVRINGDGSIKLYLANKNSTCSSNMTYNASLGSGIYGYSETSDGKYKMDYLNSKESGLADIYKTFQTSTLSSYLNNLKSGDWCIDTFSSSNINLKCSETLTSKFSDNTEMYVGTLTADEFIYAGTEFFHNEVGRVENRFYLNYGLSLPTLTYTSGTDSGVPSHMISAYGLYINPDWVQLPSVPNGNFIIPNGPFNSGTEFPAVPAINLKKDAVISSGDGTIDNPYVIE